jgi:hypothetical protein
MRIQTARKHLTGCTVVKHGREVEVHGAGLGYRVAVARNGQIRSEDVEHLKTKIPVAGVMMPRR